jgi:hypothetical protein
MYNNKINPNIVHLFISTMKIGAQSEWVLMSKKFTIIYIYIYIYIYNCDADIIPLKGWCQIYRLVGKHQSHLTFNGILFCFHHFTDVSIARNLKKRDNRFNGTILPIKQKKIPCYSADTKYHIHIVYSLVVFLFYLLSLCIRGQLHQNTYDVTIPNCVQHTHTHTQTHTL